MTNFKEGNTVQLKGKFYDEPSFKRLDRFNRKYISSLAKRRLKITHIFISCEEIITVYDEISNNSAHVPVAILELAHPKTQITGAWFDECDDKFIPPTPRKQIEPKLVLRIGAWAVPVVDLKQLSRDPAKFEKGVPFQIENIFGGAYSGDTFLTRQGEVRGIRLSHCKLLPDYKPMRKWTLEEIMYAKAFLGEFLTSRQLRLSYKNYENSRRGEEIVLTVGDKRGIARCCPTDDWNYYIGSMVAICKATGRPLPDWIKKGNT